MEPQSHQKDVNQVQVKKIKHRHREWYPLAARLMFLIQQLLSMILTRINFIRIKIIFTILIFMHHPIHALHQVIHSVIHLWRPWDHHQIQIHFHWLLQPLADIHHHTHFLHLTINTLVHHKPFSVSFLLWFFKKNFVDSLFLIVFVAFCFRQKYMHKQLYLLILFLLCISPWSNMIKSACSKTERSESVSLHLNDIEDNNYWSCLDSVRWTSFVSLCNLAYKQLAILHGVLIQWREHLLK